jgi:hypothetical protein
VRLNLAVLLTITLALPVSVEVPNRDSASAGGETRLGVSGSMGRYALIDRGCEGQVLRSHPHEYGEAGLEAVHQLGNGMSFAVRAGVIQEKATERVRTTDYSTSPPRDSVLVDESDWHNSYVNPAIAFEGTRGGIGLGVIVARRPFVSYSENEQRIRPSFHARVGRVDGMHLRAAYMESVPLYSGGGYFELGVGAHATRRLDVYGGVSAGPFDGAGFALRTEYRALPHLAISARTRLGRSGGENQSGFAVGLGYVSRPPVAPNFPPPSSKGYRSRMWKPEADTLEK